MKGIVFTLCIFLAGCAAEPAAYHSGNEIPRGAGLLTGASGEFVLSADEWRRYQEWKEREAAQPK
jgi:hypothetical protein